MGIYTTALALGVGYTLGRPDGRAQVRKYLRQARELASKPEAKRLRERGWDIAGDQVATVRRRLDRRNRAAEQPNDEPSGPVTGLAPEDLSATVPGDAASSSGSVTPGPDAVDPATGFGGTTIEEDSRAALGFPVLPPSERPGTPGPTPPGP